MPKAQFSAIMAELPPQSRAHCAPTIQAIHQAMVGTTRSAKDIRVACFWVIHFFIFLYLMRLDKDWVLEHTSQSLSNWKI